MKYYPLKDYLNILENHNLVIEYKLSPTLLEQPIQKISYNSKEVDAHTLYVCKGFKFKKEYLEEALSKKALAFIAEDNYNYSDNYLKVKDIRLALALISAYYYQYERKLNLIGVTGTKGKSTTAYYIKAILDMVTKKENAILSSIDTYDGKTKKESLLTSPESLELHEHIYNAKVSKIDNLIMEVSSQALKYQRVANVLYDVAVFLNISEDHISDVEHPDFEDYFASKLKIFNQAKNAVINLDSAYASRIIEASQNTLGSVKTFSLKDNTADFYAYDIKKEGLNKIKFKVKSKKFNQEFELNMPGLFNVENALAAIAVADILNIDLKYIIEGLKIARASGRMEVHASIDNKVIAIVDYAHNKLSFEKLYESVKEEYPDKKIITVFGCPGSKAFIRRRDLGLLSGANSYMTYLTAEDPGSEDVKTISEEIATYVKSVKGQYKIIEDRGEAITKAILENPNSVILITGKGNETRQKYGTQYLPYKSDTYYCLEALKTYEANLYVKN